MPAPGSVQLHRRRSAEGGGGGPGKPPPSHPAAARSSPELSVTCSRFVLSPGSGRSYRRSALLPPIQAAPLHRRIHAGGLPSAHVAAGGHPWPSIRMHPLRSWGGPGERPQPPAARGSRAGIGAGNAEPQQGATCGAELDPRLREAAVELEPDLQERCGPEGGTAEQDLRERCVTELEPDLQERGTAELDLRERGTAEQDLRERCVTELEPDLQERGAAEPAYYSRRRIAEWVLQVNAVLFSPSRPQDPASPHLREQGTSIKIVYQGD